MSEYFTRTESYFVYPENADDVYNSIIEYFDFY